MKRFFVKRTIIISIIFIIFVLCSLIYFIFYNKTEPTPKISVVPILTNLEPKYSIIGKSVEGRLIEAFTYGNGKTHLIFVGGIHGGYEWNSVLLAYQFIDYLNANTELIQKNMTVTVIPSANPDGVYKIIGKEGRFAITDVPTGVSAIPGRLNANDVDLNRNFDCKWQTESIWKNNAVSAGSAVFSEPETRAIRDYILKDNPVAVIFWHSMSGSVFASKCKNGILPETLNIMNVYAKASGYLAVKTFDSYAVTGDSEGWLASINIPAITVELKTHETVEWERNLAGIKALFNYYNSSTTPQ